MWRGTLKTSKTPRQKINILIIGCEQSFNNLVKNNEAGAIVSASTVSVDNQLKDACLTVGVFFYAIYEKLLTNSTVRCIIKT